MTSDPGSTSPALQEMNDEITRITNEHKRQKWRQFVETLDHKTDPTKAFSVKGTQIERPTRTFFMRHQCICSDGFIGSNKIFLFFFLMKNHKILLSRSIFTMFLRLPISLHHYVKLLWEQFIRYVFSWTFSFIFYIFKMLNKINNYKLSDK